MRSDLSWTKPTRNADPREVAIAKTRNGSFVIMKWISGKPYYVVERWSGARSKRIGNQYPTLAAAKAAAEATLT